MRNGCRRHRFAVDSYSICARVGTEGCRCVFPFFGDAVLLFFSCVQILCAVELVHQSDVFYSSVLQFYCVVQLSLCRSQWNGSVNASRRLLVLQYCLTILIVFSKSLLVDRIETATSWMRVEC